MSPSNPSVQLQLVSVSSLKGVDVVVDLRELNKGCEAKYELFWTKYSEQI